MAELERLTVNIALKAQKYVAELKRLAAQTKQTEQSFENLGDKSDEWARRAAVATARINKDIKDVRQNAARGVELNVRADTSELSGIERIIRRVRTDAQRGADMTVRGDARGLSPLLGAIAKIRSSAERGADMTVRGDSRGLSELHGAVQRLRAVVAKGADFEVRGDDRGLSELHSAIARIRAAASRGVDFELRGDGKGLSTLSAQMSRIRGDASRGADFEVHESGSAGVIAALTAVNKARGTVDGNDARVSTSVSGAADSVAELTAVDSVASKVDGKDARLSTSVSGAASTTAQIMGVDAAASKVDGRNVKLDVDRSASGILDNIGQSLADTGGKMRNFAVIIPSIAFPALLAGLGAIPPLATAAGAAVGGLASALGQGLAGAAGIGGSALAGITSGFGLVLAAATPTIRTFSNMKAATSKVASAEKTAQSASDALAAAHRGLADASKGVEEAQKSAAKGVADAQAQYQDALRGVQDAQQGVADAERGVADARKEANKGVVDAQNQYKDAVSGVEDAERTLADATRGVGDARRDAQQGVADAESRYADAVRGVEDAERKVADATQGVRDARREATKGVAEAESKYRDSLAQVADAERKVAEANQGVADARREAYQGVQDAIGKYQDALRGVADAERSLESSRRDLSQATNDLQSAQQDLNRAERDEPRNQAYATLDLADARDRASDATRDYNEAVKEYGRNSEEATDAERAMERAQLDLQAQQEKTNEARRKGSDELNAARDNVVSASDAEQQARRGVADSERALQDARRKASQEQAGIEAARQAGARKIADAQGQVADAQRALTDAVRTSNEAQAGIEQARVEGARKVADAQKQVADAQRGVQDAQRKASQAAQGIEQARVDGAKKIADAQRQVADAQRGVADANQKAAQAAAGIEQARIDGARKVADAQRAVGDAQKQVADAVRAANQAQKGIEEARIAGAKQVADAQRQVLDAQRALSKATRENASAQTALGKAAAAVGAKLTKSQAVLLAAAKRFGATFSRLIKPANDAFNRLGARILGVGERALPSLANTALKTVNAVGRAFDTLLAQWTMPRQLTLFNEALQAIPRFTRLGVQASGQLATAVGNIFIAAIPQADKFLQSLNNVTARFNAWTRSVEGQNSLQRFFAKSARYAKILGGTILDLTLGLVGLGGAFDEAGVTGQVLTGLRNTARRFRDITSASGESRKSVVAYLRDTRPTIAAMGDLLGSVTHEWFRVSGAIFKARNEAGKLILPKALKDMRGALHAIGNLLIASFKNFGPLIAPAITQLAKFMQVFIAKNPVIKTFAHLLIGALRVFNNLPGPIQSVVVSLVSMRIAMNALGIGKWLIAPLTTLRAKMATTATGMTGLAAKTNVAAAANTRLSTSAKLTGGTLLVTGKKAQAAKAGTAAAGASAAAGAGKFAKLRGSVKLAGLALTAMAGGPVGLAVAGIAAVGVGLVAAYKHSKAFRGAMKGLGRQFIDNKGISALYSQSLAGLRKRIKEAGGVSKITGDFFKGLGKKMSDNKGISVLWAGKLTGLRKKLRGMDNDTKTATKSNADLGVKIRNLNKRLEEQGGGIANIRRQWNKPPIYKRQDWGGKLIGWWKEVRTGSDKTYRKQVKDTKESGRAWGRLDGTVRKNTTSMEKRVNGWAARTGDRIKKGASGMRSTWDGFWKGAGNLWDRSFNGLFHRTDKWSKNNLSQINSGNKSKHNAWNSFWKGAGSLWDRSFNSLFHRTDKWSKTNLNQVKSGNKAKRSAWDGFWKGARSLWDHSFNSLFHRTGKWSKNNKDQFKNNSKANRSTWSDMWSKMYHRADKAFNSLWDRARKWGKNFKGIFGSTVNGVRDWLSGLANALANVLEALGMKKAASGLKDRAGKLDKPLKFARGGVSEPKRYARGGVETGVGQVTSGITAIAGEAGRESIVPLTRRTPEGQDAFRKAAAGPNGMGAPHRAGRYGAGKTDAPPPGFARGGVVDPPRYARGGVPPVKYQPPTRNWNDEAYGYVKKVEAKYPDQFVNTYQGHGQFPGGEAQSWDVWGPTRGSPIGTSLGNEVYSYIHNLIGDRMKYMIWRGQIEGWGKKKPYTGYGGQHYDHVHTSIVGPGEEGTARGGGIGGAFSGVKDALGNAYNSVKDFVAKRFKPPEIPSLGLGDFGAGLTGGLSKMVLGGAKKYVTKLAEEKLSMGSGGGSGGPGTDFDGGSNRGIGKKMNAAMGWGGQWPSLEKLWTKESNWNERATNPSSGAYGIPQALPGSKMSSSGSDWKTNPATQIDWGLGYIKGRYGDPNAAWGHSQRVGWYRKGGIVPGPKGQPQSATVHGGERVLPEEYVRSWDNVARALDNFGRRPEVKGAALNRRVTKGGSDLAEQNDLLKEQNAILRDLPNNMGAAGAAIARAHTRSDAFWSDLEAGLADAYEHGNDHLPRT